MNGFGSHRPETRAATGLGAALLASALLAGCAGDDLLVQSLGAPGTYAAEDAPSGVVYSLPKALLPITLERRFVNGGAGPMELDMNARELIIAPDPAYTFTLNYKHDSFSADSVTVHTTPDGLLQMIATTSRDEATGVITGVIKLATEFAKGFAAGPLAPLAMGRTQALAPPPPARPFKVTLLIDPTAPNLAEDVRDKLRLYNVTGVTLRAVDMGAVGETRTPEELHAYCQTGACYRRTAPLTLEAFDEATGTGVSLTTAVPNHGVVGRLDFQRRSFVENNATAQFDNGMLVKVTYIDPSEAAATANAPVDAVRSIFAIPGAIWQSQTADLQREQALLDARGKLLDERGQLLQAQQRFQAIEAQSRQDPQ